MALAPAAAQPGRLLPPRLAARAAAAVADVVGEIDLGAVSTLVLESLLASLGAAVLSAGVPVALGFGLAFIPINRSSRGKWVHVGGPNDLSYMRNLDERNIHFRFKDAQGKEREIIVPPSADGAYRDDKGRVIARWIKAGARVGLAISVSVQPVTQLGDGQPEPRLCPMAEGDRQGGREKDRDYEDYVKRLINPQAPTQRGYGYWMPNPVTGGATVFDDCQKATGILIEAKGTGFAGKITADGQPGEGMIKKMLAQATRQVQASQGRPIYWIFAEKATADRMRLEFRNITELKSIRVLTIPWREGMK